MKVFRTELKRALCSPGFAAGIAGAVIAGLLGGYEFTKTAMSGAAIEAVGELSVQSAYMAMYSGVFMLVIPILCTLPGAASFMEDLGSRFIRAYLPRAGRNRYLVSKAAATAISGALSVFGGLLVMLLIYTILFPPTGIEMKAALSGDYAITYFAFFRCTLFVVIGCCLWALAGGISAAVTMNKYMAYACPFILYYVVSSFQERYFAAFWVLSPREWIMPEHIDLSQAIIYPAAATAVLFFTYILLMNRRLRDV